MPIEIAGLRFEGFPGRDSAHLSQLGYRDRVRWLRYRFELVFLTPFNELLKCESRDCYIWLCAVNLLCSAVEALAKFEFPGNGRKRFVAFVEEYFSAEFLAANLRLHDPNPTVGGPAIRSAEHLYKYFRSGLAHSFCIEWGGLLHREDGAPSYLFEAATGPGHKSLGIVPRELVADFGNAVRRFFELAETRDPAAPEILRFNDCFDKVFMAKTGPPIP